MPRRRDLPNTQHLKTLIATTAARLMAENGITDYALAKRKAAFSLDLPDGTPLPDNTEIEAELRVYQRLYLADEHDEQLRFLRRRACQLMALLQRFNPYLAGSVLDGTAGRFAEIDIQLYADSAKDVEIFLLNENLPFEHSEPRSERAEAVLTLTDATTATANLIVYPRDEERVTVRTRDGKIRPRAKLDAVRALLDTPED